MSPQIGRKGTKVNPWELAVNSLEWDEADEECISVYPDYCDEDDEGDRWDVYPYNVQKH